MMYIIDEASAIPDEIWNSANTCCGHASDCAVHSEPAYPAGDCTCGYAVWDVVEKEKQI